MSFYVMSDQRESVSSGSLSEGVGATGAREPRSAQKHVAEEQQELEAATQNEGDASLLPSFSSFQKP